MLLAFCPQHARGQKVYAAIGPGSFIQVGATGSLAQNPYGQRYLGGETLFVDAHLYRKIGVEADATFLNLHQDLGQKQTTYLIGPRYSIFTRNLRPYGKFLVGRGEYTFPYNYARGSYFVMSPGGGVDYRVHNSRFTFRLVDLEYQIWPGFSYGPLHSLSASAGLAFTVFRPSIDR